MTAKEFPAGAKIAVAMSGGVDSAVAALLLKNAGADVFAVFMKNWEDDDTAAACHDKEDLLAAAAAAEVLRADFHVANFAAEYKTRVFAPFLDSLRAGLTPNPDVLCNSEIKFEAFRRFAKNAGADFAATGHYARIQKTDGEPPRLLKGEDSAKDQSYFLHRLSAAQLADFVFPLGGMHKPDVRAAARAAGFANWARKESMGICFIGKRNFNDFLQNYLRPEPGEIQTPEGETIGEHRGLPFYTIGQRRGLNIGGGAPLFAAKKLPQKNILVAAPEGHPLLYSSNIKIKNARWISGAPPKTNWVFSARLRHRQPPAACTLQTADMETAQICFAGPQLAPAPGQYAVIYDGNACLGGGEIVGE